MADKKRGRVFSKLARAITIAAREGADPAANFKLRLAVEKARQANMPKENIERAIRRASLDQTRGRQGKLAGGKFEEIVFEGYGPGGVAIMIQTATDNRLRTASEVKSVLEKAGGRLGEKGCVSYLFRPKGVITVRIKDRAPEEIMLKVIDFGAQDVEKVGAVVIAYTKPEELESIKEQILKQGFIIESADINLEPETTVKITDPPLAEKILSLMDKLEELDDTRKVYASFDISEQLLAEFS